MQAVLPLLFIFLVPLRASGQSGVAGGVSPSSSPLAGGGAAPIRMPLVDGNDIRFRQIRGVNSLSQTRAAPTVQDGLGFFFLGTQYGLN